LSSFPKSKYLTINGSTADFLVEELQNSLVFPQTPGF
jgi:hypothetical protein